MGSSVGVPSKTGCDIARSEIDEDAVSRVSVSKSGGTAKRVTAKVETKGKRGMVVRYEKEMIKYLEPTMNNLKKKGKR